MVHRPSPPTPNQTFELCRSEWNHRLCLLPLRKADCCYYCFLVSVFFATSNGTASDWFFTGSYTDFRSAIDNVSTKPRRIFILLLARLIGPPYVFQHGQDQSTKLWVQSSYILCLLCFETVLSLFHNFFFLLVLTSNISMIFNFIKTVCSSQILPYQKSPDPSMNN